MGRVIRNSIAETDLTEIWLYIAQDSVEAADRWIDNLGRTLDQLLDFPRMGTTRDDLQRGLRSYPFGDYLIFYLISREDIVVTRVLHGAKIFLRYSARKS